MEAYLIVYVLFVRATQLHNTLYMSVVVVIIMVLRMVKIIFPVYTVGINGKTKFYKIHITVCLNDKTHQKMSKRAKKKK